MYKHWKNAAKDQGFCFVTTTIEEYIPLLTEPANATLVLSALDFYRKKYGFFIHGYVVMPEHIHLLLSLQGTISLQKLMSDFKRYTAKQLLQWCYEEGRQEFLGRFAKRGAIDCEQHSVWQRSFRSVPLMSDKAVLVKAAYIHNNPVRRGLADKPEDWLFSSASAYAGGSGPITVDILEA